MCIRERKQKKDSHTHTHTHRFEGYAAETLGVILIAINVGMVLMMITPILPEIGESIVDLGNHNSPKSLGELNAFVSTFSRSWNGTLREVDEKEDQGQEGEVEMSDGGVVQSPFFDLNAKLSSAVAELNDVDLVGASGGQTSVTQPRHAVPPSSMVPRTLPHISELAL